MISVEPVVMLPPAAQIVSLVGSDSSAASAAAARWVQRLALLALVMLGLLCGVALHVPPSH